MAKKKTRRRRNSFTIPIAPMIPVTAIVYTHASELIRGVDPYTVLDRFSTEMVGYSFKYGGFSMEGLKRGLIPIGAGLLAHKVASKLGFNRMLASAGVPILRI